MHTSYWKEFSLPSYPHITTDGHYDVVIVGGGITGLTAAYFLTRAGKKVCLLESDHIGSGNSGLTTAHLTKVTDTRLTELVRAFGEDAARLVWNAGSVAMNAIEQIASELNIDCRFQRVPGYLHEPLDFTDESVQRLREEADLASKLGFDATYLPVAPLMNRPAVHFPGQARFHPLMYLAGLARAVSRMGCEIYEKALVSDIREKPLAVECNGRQLECDYLVIATHAPLPGAANSLAATVLQSRVAAYSTYVVSAVIPQGTIPDALFWDTAEPYHYFRLDSDPETEFDYVILGGEDHKTGHETDTGVHYEHLEALLNKLVPFARIDRRWSGQVLESSDGLPFMGELAEHQFVATGFGGNGMTFGTIGGLMACDAMLGRHNPWQKLFAPTRANIVQGVWDYLRENVDYPYYMITDRFAVEDDAELAHLAPGEGKIIRFEGQRLACSRDCAGHLSAVSAVCPHMGCLVHWNQAEATWDCPCHGSRFHADGQLIAGPAKSNLEHINLPAGAAH